MLSVLFFNMVSVLAGSLIGSLFNKHIRAEIVEGVMTGIGAVIIFIGATGISADTSPLVLLCAYALGCFAGFGLDLEGKLNRLSEKIEAGFGSGDKKMISPGINFFIISCCGAYTINACFFAGTGDYSLFYTKIVLDLVVSIAMSSALGIGVASAIMPMTLFQGALIMLSGVLSSVMTPEMINAFATSGSLIAVLIGTNMIGATQVKIVNFTPAIILAPIAAIFAA